MPKCLHDFTVGDFVIHPAHGVGRISEIKEQSIFGQRLKLLMIHYDKENMTLSIPVSKIARSHIRRPISVGDVRKVMTVLSGRARAKRGVWARKVLEYKARINSGDPIAIAEVIRDLHRGEGQPDQSYSGRQIYEAARERLVRELAVATCVDETQAAARLDGILHSKAV